MKNTLNNILVLAIATSFGFTSCKKQKDNLDLGGSKGGEKTYDCPTLKKNFREDCETKEGDEGFVNADCECQKRNLESDDKKGRGDKKGDKKDWDKKDKKDWDKKDKKDWDKKDKKDWDKKDKKDWDKKDKKDWDKKDKKDWDKKD
ncbi:MAG: hypothetical protein P8I77_04575, partial [Bacteroidia bacterium]|nr:hypothetical protein [Bacteroidia bacterium]